MEGGAFAAGCKLPFEEAVAVEAFVNFQLMEAKGGVVTKVPLAALVVEAALCLLFVSYASS